VIYLSVWYPLDASVQMMSESASKGADYWRG
jgi:hypothetical protein